MRNCILTLLIALTTCQFVHADYALRWSPTSSSSTGAPITVDLFLDENSPDTNLANYGAAGATYDVYLAGVGSLSTPVGNPNFDLATPTGSGSFVSLSQTSFLGLTAMGSLKVGSFTINPTTNGMGNLTISTNGTLADFSVYDSMFVPQVLDGSLYPTAPTFNFSFSAVPEPSSALTAVSLGGIATFHRRRRRKAPRSGVPFARRAT